MTAAGNWLRPEGFPAGVGALMSTRLGGVSAPPWDQLNLGTAVDDDPAAVAENRRRFSAALSTPLSIPLSTVLAADGGVVPVFMRQVHGTRVLRLGAAHALPGAPIEEADACITTEPGLACTVQVADCLPVLFAAPEGGAVGAAHAGWRGLAGGVLEATLAALCDAAGCAPADVRAWLGPCIGPDQFEVGADVWQAFEALPPAAEVRPGARFKPGRHAGKWLADLPGLARDRLQTAGVVYVAGGTWCTVTEPSRFFSFRRDGTTGRMAAAVWIDR